MAYSIANSKYELLKEKACLILTKASNITNALEKFATTSIFLDNSWMCWSQVALFKVNNIWVPHRHVINDFPLDDKFFKNKYYFKTI